MSPEVPPELSRGVEDLLEGQVEWVRSLARRLAADPSEADDLAQDACLVALADRTRRGFRPRPWLAAVVRNLLHQRVRGEARRRAREEESARGEATAGVDQIVAQVQVGRELARMVLELDEPYRTALLLRFWEDLPPREIAARLDVPVATVNSRLARGIARLRERLERERGGREAWLSALAPLLAPQHSLPPLALPPLSIGGIVVNAKIALLAAGSVLVASVLLLLAQGPREPEDAVALAAHESTPDAPRPLAAPGDPLAAGAPDVIAGRRTAESHAPADAPPGAATATPSSRVIGRVVDADGRPLGGLSVGSGASVARSSAGGAFELATPAERLTLEVLEPDWTTVRSGRWSAGSSLEPIVVAARAIVIAGEVVDPDGTPIDGARVTFALPAGFDARFDRTLEASEGAAWGVASDAAGRFELRPAPLIPGATLSAVREGWMRTAIEAPQGDASDLRIVLARPAIPLQGALRGRVVDELGTPVARARVFLGLASTTTDEDGRFGLALSRAVTSDRIVAVYAGHRPALLDRPREPRGEDSGWPDEVVLVLGGPPLSIRGRVVDDAGRPRAGVRVSISDPTPIGAIGAMPATAEGMMSGLPVPPLALDSEADLPESDGDSYRDWRMRVGPPSAFWHYVKTDADGRFEIGGLDDRRYRLRVVDPATLAALTSEPIRAGDAEARIEMPPPAVWPELLGRVVDDEGRGIEGVRVQLGAEAYGVRSRVLGGQVYVSIREPREGVVTDADGRFRLADVPKTGAGLAFKSETIVPRELLLDDRLDPADVRVQVAQRVSFEVRLARPIEPAPDAIGLLDAQGEGVEVLKIEVDRVNAYTEAALVDGRTGVLSASTAARTLVLLRDGEIVQSVPIRLRPGETNVIEP